MAFQGSILVVRLRAARTATALSSVVMGEPPKKRNHDSVVSLIQWTYSAWFPGVVRLECTSRVCTSSPKAPVSRCNGRLHS
jgi:hypothetical protein